MKRNALVRIIIYCIVLAILVSVLGFGIKGGNNFFDGIKNNIFGIYLSDNDYDDDNYTVYNDSPVSLDTSKINSVEIYWAQGSVNISSNDKQNDITLSETSKEDISDSLKMRYCVVDNCLEIHFASSGFSSIIESKKDLSIVLPNDFNSRQIEVEVASADISIENIKSEEIDIDSASGDLLLNNISSSEINCDCISGSVNINNTNASKIDCNVTSSSANINGAFSKEISVDTVSGNVDINSTICPNTISVDSVSGSINVIIPKDSSFSADLDTTSGSFSSGFATKNSDGKYICGNGSSNFDFSSISGSVSVNPE